MSTLNEQPSIGKNITQPSILPYYFVSYERTYVVLWYMFMCVVSLILHSIFIIGIRRLCGWKSNFSFTLLLITSVLCIIRYIAEFIAIVTALFYMDWIKYQILWILLGSFAYAPYFTVVLLNVVTTFHRLIYTAFPFRANDFLGKATLQIILIAIFFFYLALLMILNTDLLGIRWVDSFMSWAIMKNRNPSVFRLLNTISNYGVGIVNFFAYSILFALLFQRKLISFKQNREMKMTLQVLCMVICEVLFFLYWEFWSFKGFGAWDLVVSETSNLLFFDVLIIPYLILNEFVSHFLLSCTNIFLSLTVCLKKK